MATYAIGDVHGCYDSLCRLLEKINYDESTDRLWFVGDLVNRGPKSLKTLRFVKRLGDKAVTVLGNHDIHLLALHYGVRKRKDKDSTLFKTLDTEDASELINWLQSQPLVHIENKTIMVHAGVHPDWSMDSLLSIKRELETAIAAVKTKCSLSDLYGETSGTWEKAKNSPDRLLYALNTLTRMRYCKDDAAPDYECSAPPGRQPDHLLPWYEIHNKHLEDHTILFGHWAALGYRHYNNVYALDSGCAWGNALTALRLEDKQVFQWLCKR